MITRMLRKGVLYIKGIQDAGLYAIMGNSKWFSAFSGTTFFYVMLPFIGVLMTAISVINAFELAQTSNKNFDSWFNFIVSAISAGCSSVSLYGAAISTAMGVSFVAGPWFFLSSVLAGAFHQGVMLALNLYRAYESQDELSKSSYFQSALNNVFILGMLTAIVGAVCFVMLSPVAPIIGSACAFSAAIFTVADIGWHLMPTVMKEFVKGSFGIIPANNNLKRSVSDDPVVKSTMTPKTNHIENIDLARQQRLFSHPNYSEQIKHMDQVVAEGYLRQLILSKMDLLRPKIKGSEKNTQKLQLLSELLSSLDSNHVLIREDVLINYPSVFESFWSKTGEVEQLYNAVIRFNNSREPMPDLTERKFGYH